MSGRRRVFYAGLLFLSGALVTDRVALYAWQRQVLAFSRSLQEALDHGLAEPPSGRPFVAMGTEQLLIMPKHTGITDRYLTVRLDRSMLGVESVTVDGAGNLHLRFFPPILAWTTRILPFGEDGHHADPVGQDPRYHYQLRISIKVSGDGSPVIEVQRGEYHFAPVLRNEALRPLWFP